MVGIEEGFHEPNSHMSWPLFINVSSAIYRPRNLMGLRKACYAGRSGLGDVQSGQKSESSRLQGDFWVTREYRLKWPLAFLVAIYALAVVAWLSFSAAFCISLIGVPIRPKPV